MIRVALVDDQALIRSGIRALLGAEDDIEVVAEAGDGDAGLAIVRDHVPDVVLMDVQMPRMDGIEAARRIASEDALAAVRVVMLTNYGHDEYVFNALRAGASGFVVKDTEPDELISAVRIAARGDALLSPAITRRLIEEFAARPADVVPADALDLLTKREREVMVMVAHGLSNDEIAAEMVLATATVKTHVSRAMTKLHTRDRAQLVVAAYQTGLVSARA